MTELLVALATVFVVGGAFLFIANQLDLPTVPFFIIAGVAAGVFIDEDIVLEFARYGIAFLVFTFGVGVNFQYVRTVLRDSEYVALGQVAVMGGLGFLVAVALGAFVDDVTVEKALYFGVAAALSSTIVATGMLEADIRDNLVHARVSNSIHFIQDLVAIAVLLVLSAEAFAPDPVAASIGYGVVLLVAAAFIHQFVFPMISRLAGGSDELTLISIVTLLIVFLGASEYMGVSIAVGAFAAGVAVRHEPVEHIGVFNGLESIHSFFVTVFFVTVGALVTVPSSDVLVLAFALAVLTAVVKPMVTVALMMQRGYDARSATLTGFNLDQVSEFALIIVIEAIALGVLVYPVSDAIILAAAATMITSSLTREYDEEIYGFLYSRGWLWEAHDKTDRRSKVADDLEEHVVVVGFGRQGRRLAETCREIDRAVVVVDNDPNVMEDMEIECESYVFGDVMDDYTLGKARVDDATLVVSTVDQPAVSRRLLDAVDGDVFLRTSSSEEARKLLEEGATYVAVPDVLAGDVLQEHVEGVADDPEYAEELRRRGMENLREILHRNPNRETKR